MAKLSIDIDLDALTASSEYALTDEELFWEWEMPELLEDGSDLEPLWY